MEKQNRFSYVREIESLMRCTIIPLLLFFGTGVVVFGTGASRAEETRRISRAESTSRSTPSGSARPLDAAATGLDEGLLTDEALLDEALLDEGDDLLGDSSADDLLSADGDDLLPGGDDGTADPLSNLAPTSQAKSGPDKGSDPHEALWTENCYPSAETCRKCHPRQYEEWRASGHAYASVSPMFNRFEQAMIQYTRGTVGHFCLRCHSPVGTQLEIPRTTSMLDAPAVVREGVTCIACHRVREHYWRGSNGDRRIEPGDIHAPVGGGHGGAGVAEAVAQAEQLKLKLNPHASGPGQPMHRSGYFFEPIKTSDVCVSCHQVAVHPGIWLEVVHAQYRNGPAAKKGISCQQCHMGEVPGKPNTYAWGHAAEINGKPFGTPRKQSNHMFWGPGYSIAHPGIFPHNPDAKDYSPREWMGFDYRSGWGTEVFEAAVRPGTYFPPPWDTADDRRDGRKIINANLKKLDFKRSSAIVTMQAGVDVEGPFFANQPRAGRALKVSYRVSNISEGHNLPTGSLGAQPQLWLNVALIDPDGCRVWESGLSRPQWRPRRHALGGSRQGSHRGRPRPLQLADQVPDQQHSRNRSGSRAAAEL